MEIAVLGTGMVGQTLARGFAGLGHDVVVGTRDPAVTLARTEGDAMGPPPYATWQAENPGVRLVPFAEAGTHGQVVVNATSGTASLAVLQAVGADRLAGRVLLDVANALDHSSGFPALAVANTDSLAEQIQRAFPGTHVVKALNTVNCRVMVDPAQLPEAHDAFVAGDDAAAKETVVGLLHALGWAPGHVLDLGGLRAARGMEMYLPLWISLMQQLGTSAFNVRVVRG
ncbi:MAG: NADPH-dependent F420 reductase [Actinomycetes bacterium]